MQEKIIKAIALRYEENKDVAPLVLAKGQGSLAEAILQLAKEAEVPSVTAPELVSLLEGVEVGECIPPEAYQLTAEILAFLWHLEDRLAQVK